jgi:hypothetical protein
MAEKDVESGKPTKIPYFQQVYDQAGVTPEVLKHDYAGSGTEDDPYVVTWIENDPRNPMLYSKVKKWSITMLVAFATLAVAFVSSAYSGGADEVIKEFKIGEEVFVLGTSLFVLGFAIGKYIWLSKFGSTNRRQDRYYGLPSPSCSAARFCISEHMECLPRSMPEQLEAKTLQL